MLIAFKELFWDISRDRAEFSLIAISYISSCWCYWKKFFSSNLVGLGNLTLSCFSLKFFNLSLTSEVKFPYLLARIFFYSLSTKSKAEWMGPIVSDVFK